MILIDTTYINSSGGKYLLEYLLDTLIENEDIHNYLFIFDNRLDSDRIKLIPESNRFNCKPSEFNRYFLFKKVFLNYNIKSLFCFGNVPPPFKFRTKCPVYIYFHNVLLSNPWTNNHKFSTRFLLYLKSLYIHFTATSSLVWIVQTKIVKQTLKTRFGFSIDKILVVPFSEPIDLSFSTAIKQWQYFYPAEGFAQKNHYLLLKVWEQLSRFNIRPKLILTIDSKKFPDLSFEISRLILNNVNIENCGFISRDEVLNKLKLSKFMIFPSLNESFGLPLIEAASLGCHLITSNLDYVSNVIETNANFSFENNSLFDLIFAIETKNFFTIPPNIKIENEINILIKLINNNYV